MAPAIHPKSLAKPVLACLAAAAGSWAAAQPALYEGALPTRMQFCQLELQGVEGEERRQLLRECLLRRADAERLVVRDCRRQLREARVAADERFRRQRDCEYRALAVPWSELPQPTLAVAAPQALPASDAVATDLPAPTIAPVTLAPAGPVTPVEVQAAP